MTTVADGTQRRRAARPTVQPLAAVVDDWPTRLLAGGPSPKTRLRLGLSLVASVLVHASAFAYLSIAPGGGSTVVLYGVQSGRASVELAATMAAVRGRAADDEDLDEAALLHLPIDRPRPVVEERLPPETLAPRGRAAATMPRGGAVAAEPARQAPSPYLPPRRRRETAPQLAAAVVRVPRVEIDPSLPVVPVVSDVDSAASAGSVGSRGADRGPPEIVFNPAPVYPPEALEARLTGRVLLRVVVGPAGEVLTLRIHQSSGVASLDASALTAVQSWRFSPAALPRREVLVPVRFRLDAMP